LVPIITGWVTIDLAPHIDANGFITNEGENLAWGIMAGAPEGVNIRLCVGGLRALVSGRLMHGLIEGGISKAHHIDVQGSDPRGVAAILIGLRGLLEMAA
jgi:hypothetical protein